MSSAIAWLALCWSLVALAAASEEERPDATVTVDRSRPVWMVTVKNQGPGVLRYSLLDDRPRHLGIEFWWEGRGFEIYAWDLARTRHFNPFAADDRGLSPGKHATFFLDPRDVSAEKREVIELWRRGLEEFEFYDCRVFFQEYASVRFNSQDDERQQKAPTFEQREYTNTEIFVAEGQRAEQRKLFATYQRVLKGEEGLKPRGPQGAGRLTFESFGVEFFDGTHVALEQERGLLIIRHLPSVLDDLEFRFDLKRKVEGDEEGTGDDQEAGLSKP